MQNKTQENHIKLLGKIIALAIFILLIYGCILFNNNYYNQETLRLIAKSNINMNTIVTPNWYFFYNDRIYAYTSGKKTTARGLYSYNLDGSNEKLIVKANIEDCNIIYPYFYMVRNNEAYFSVADALKKINLSTGEITTIVKDKFLNILPDTFNNEKVLVTYTNDTSDKAYTYFAKLDLQTFELTEEKILNFNVAVPYYYSKIDDSIYYINKLSKGLYNVYKDKDIIYTYQEDLEDKKSTPNSNFVFVQDNYIFVVLFNKVLKLSRDDYSVVKENDIVNNYSLIKSGSSKKMRSSANGNLSTSYISLENPIFQNNKDIYKFNSETMTFEKIIDNDFDNCYVQKYEKYLVIENVIGNVINNDSQIIIYNTETQNYQKYDAYNYTVEDTNIYLMTFKKKIMFKNSFFTKDDFFEVKKISLNEI